MDLGFYIRTVKQEIRENGLEHDTDPGMILAAAVEMWKANMLAGAIKDAGTRLGDTRLAKG